MLSTYSKNARWQKTYWSGIWIEKALCARMQSTVVLMSTWSMWNLTDVLTDFEIAHLFSCFKLSNGDVQGTERPCPSNARATVDNHGRSQGVTQPGRCHHSYHLGLLLSDTLEELQHGKSRVRGAVVRPTCELEMADRPLFPSDSVGQPQVRDYEVFIVLYVFWVHCVVATCYACPCHVSEYVLGKGPCVEMKAFLCL